MSIKDNFYKKEGFWYALFSIAIFFVYAYTKKSNTIHFHDFLFFANYAIAALIINFLLLPHYLYKKKYLFFSIYIISLIAYVIILEEFLLEQIFYPNTRGTSFPGVIFTLLEILPIILLFVGFKFAWDAHHKQLELDQLKHAMINSELQFLKSQVNPHFLFNNLNNLYSFALENSPKVPDIVLQLSSLLRYMLYESSEQLVPLEKELKYLQDFINLQKLQIEGRGHTTFITSGNTSNHFIAPLLLISFIENSFKHSSSSQVDQIQIDINISIENHILIMKCENTYSKNINNDNLTSGIGLDNVKSRLALLYPKKYKLKISQEDDIYSVELELNLEQ